jgi:carbamoyltransferase
LIHAQKHTYVLGLNTYDHDVSACLLRDGEIAYAIAKERITREKHASGFYKDVIDYCLDAEGITLDDIDLVVRNCYILPVSEMEDRLLYQDMPGFLPEYERADAKSHPYFHSQSEKVVSISHHLAHAYSAFAVSPFQDGAIMIVDGVGSYRADVSEPFPESDVATPLARDRELLPVFRLEARMHQEGLDGAGSRLPQRRVLQHARPRRALQPCLDLHLRRLEQVRRTDGPRAIWASRQCRSLMSIKDNTLTVPRWTSELNKPYIMDTGQKWETSPLMKHWEDLAWRVQDDTEKVLLARAAWLHETTGAKNLCVQAASP